MDAGNNGRVHTPNGQGIELRRRDEESGTESEPLRGEASEPDAATTTLNSCSQIVFWKCKLWMVIGFAFLLLIIVTVLSLILYSGVYIDEDEFWDPELIASGKNYNFSGTVKIYCSNPNVLLPEPAYDLLFKNLNKRFKDVYSYSPALGRYFSSAEVISFSDENNTASYYLQFLLPPETEDFMKHRMNKEFVMNILRQNIYDQEFISVLEVPECTNIILDPSSVTITSCSPRFGRQIGEEADRASGCDAYWKKLLAGKDVDLGGCDEQYDEEEEKVTVRKGRDSETEATDMSSNLNSGSTYGSGHAHSGKGASTRKQRKTPTRRKVPHV